MNDMKNLQRSDSLDLIQNYVLNEMEIKDISSEMFRLFFEVIELGREVRLALINKNDLIAQTKIADIFLTLVSLCNSMNINLFEAIRDKENELKIAI